MKSKNAYIRKLIWKSKQKSMTYNKNPNVELKKCHWAKRIGCGAVFGPEFTTLMNVIKDSMIEDIYKSQNFFEITLPKLEDLSVSVKTKHTQILQDDIYYAVDQNYKKVGMLTFAQCPPFWKFLTDLDLNQSSFPIKVYDCSGPTFRREKKNTGGFERLEEFHRLEGIWVGNKTQTIESWQKLESDFKKFYDQILDLEFRMVAVTPCWTIDKNYAPAGTTIDFEAKLPYGGWLEIQNAGPHGDVYSKAFNLKYNHEYLWTGCAGSGLERIAFALLAQKGFDTKNWPTKIREKLKNGRI